MFMKHYVSVERYEDVERKLNELEGKPVARDSEKVEVIEKNNANLEVDKSEDNITAENV